MATRLKTQYDKDIKKKMMDKFKYSNVHQIPKLEKIIVLIDDGVLALKTEDIVSKLKMHSNFDG